MRPLVFKTLLDCSALLLHVLREIFSPFHTACSTGACRDSSDCVNATEGVTKLRAVKNQNKTLI